MHTPVRVLFVCDGGTARSRIAEALLHNLGGDRYDVYSAGIDAEDIDLCALEVMREIGIKLNNTPTQALNDFEDMQFDYVIALCEEAKSACLDFPRDGHNLHWVCPDPSLEPKTKNDQLMAFRNVRLHLQHLIEGWLSDM